MPESPANEWEKAYEASIQREREAARERPEYDFYTFMGELRGYCLLAGAVAGLAVVWGYWVVVIAVPLFGTLMWRRVRRR